MLQDETKTDVQMTKKAGEDSEVEKDEKSNIPAVVYKYWAQRYSLFHRFDDGIVLDEEGWYSVTPERIAAQIAQRFKGMAVVADLFSGPGGNCIQFALNGSMVIGIENNMSRINMALNNARVYGVEHLMEFILGDVYDVLPTLAKRPCPIEGIFMSAPWGGPEYRANEVYDVSVFKKAVDGARQVTPNVAVLVPRNAEKRNIIKTFGLCEVQNNYYKSKLKTKTIYFGNIVEKDNASLNISDLKFSSTSTAILRQPPKSVFASFGTRYSHKQRHLTKKESGD